MVYCVSRFLSPHLLNSNPSSVLIFQRFQFLNGNPSAFANANLLQQSLCLPSFVSSSPHNILILTKGGWFNSGICALFLWLLRIIIQCKDEIILIDFFFLLKICYCLFHALIWIIVMLILLCIWFSFKDVEFFIVVFFNWSSTSFVLWVIYGLVWFWFLRVVLLCGYLNNLVWLTYEIALARDTPIGCFNWSSNSFVLWVLYGFI